MMEIMKHNKIISPCLEKGEFAGVRVTIGDEDFVIAPKDYQNRKWMTWTEMMDALKVDGLNTWDYRQICLTMAYRKEIDKVLKDNGGDSLDNWYWTCTENSVGSAFSYYGYNGSLEIISKLDVCSVRPIKNLKKNS